MLFAAAVDVGAIRPVFASTRLLGKSDNIDSCLQDGGAWFDGSGISSDILFHGLTARCMGDLDSLARC